MTSTHETKINDIHMPSSMAHVVCLGDSITHGDTGLGYHVSHPWPETVGAILNIDVQGFGHDGASTVDYRTYPEWEMAKLHLPDADLIVVGLGTNDVDLENARTEETVKPVVSRF